MYSVSESFVHKLVKYFEPILSIRWRKVNEATFCSKGRKELEARMSKMLGEKISGLSTELQEILIDDMVTAFENRLNVLNTAQAKDTF